MTSEPDARKSVYLTGSVRDKGKFVYLTGSSVRKKKRIIVLVAFSSFFLSCLEELIAGCFYFVSDTGQIAFSLTKGPVVTVKNKCLATLNGQCPYL